MKDNRELFERNFPKPKDIYWCENLNDYNYIDKGRGNPYAYDNLISYRFAWKSWQASANRQGYKLVPVEPSENQWSGLARHLGRYMQMHDRYCPKTLKKYFDRFIGEPPEWLSKEVGSWDSDHAFATADLPVFIYKAMIGAVE